VSQKAPFMMSTLLASSSSHTDLFVLPTHHDARKSMCAATDASRHHRSSRPPRPASKSPPTCRAQSVPCVARAGAAPRRGVPLASVQAGFCDFASGRCGLFLLMACPGKRPGHRFDLRKSAAAWILGCLHFKQCGAIIGMRVRESAVSTSVRLNG